MNGCERLQAGESRCCARFEALRHQPHRVEKEIRTFEARDKDYQPK